MSKDRYTPSSKHKKKKRVVAVTAPPPVRPAPAKLPVAAKPKPPAPPVRPAPRAEAPLPPAEVGRWSISLEVGLYGLLAVIAFLVRLYALGRFPLQESEAARAWTAWQIFRGMPEAALAGHSPLPVFAAALSFLLFGAGDAAARLIPALAGGVCVVLPYFLRRALGRTAALVAAVFLAIGPSFVFASRLVEGGMIVVAGTLALLAWGLAYWREDNDTYLYAGAITLGVMFAADKTAGPTVLILGVLALVGWWRSGEELPLLALRNGAVIFLATTILLSTGLGSNLDGMQTGLVEPLTVWITTATAVPLAERAAFYLRVLLAYEPMIVLGALLAVLAVVASRMRRTPTAVEEASDEEPEETEPFSLTPFLGIWAVASVVFYLLVGDRSPASVVQVVLPLTLLAAQFIGAVIESGQMGEAGADAWRLAVLILLIVLALIAWSNPSTLFGGRFTSLERRIQTATAVLLAIITLGMAGIAAWYGYRLRLKGVLLALGLACALVLGVYTVHSTWQLNHVEWYNATEPMLSQRTALDVRVMLEDVRAVSRRQGDDAMAITLDDRVPQPVRWYLRQFLNVSTVRVGAATKTPVVIVPAAAKDATSKTLGREYVNQRYRLSYTWSPQAPLIRWLRWAHVREAVGPLAPSDIVAFYKLPQ